MSAPPVRVALCGLGMVARTVYIPLLARHTDTFTIAAVCDHAEERLGGLGERLGVPKERRFCSVDDLAASGVADAALLMTSGSHGAASRVLLDAGLALLCEKPLAYTRAEANELQQHSSRLLLGYMKLFDPAVEAAAEALPEIGELRSVDVAVLHPSTVRQLRPLADPPPPVPPPATSPQSDELKRRALGAEAAAALGDCYTEVLLGSLVHDFALVRTLVGQPTRIDRAQRWGKGGTSVAVQGWLPGDAHLDVRWHLLPDYPSYTEELRLHGEVGSVELTFPSPYLLNHPTELEVRLTEGGGERRFSRVSHAEAFDRQLLSFAELVRGHTPPRSTVAGGRADIVTCQQIAAALAASEQIPIVGEAAQP